MCAYAECIYMRVCMCSHTLMHVYAYVSVSAWLMFSQNTLLNIYTRVHYLFQECIRTGDKSKSV